MTQFMKPQIEFGKWLLVDGACGIGAVPADLVYVPKWMTPEVDYDTDCMEEDSDLRNVLDSVEDFIESNVDDVTSVQLIEGYGARLSAPGFMDSTAWTVFETIAGATDYLEETYGDE